MQYMHVNLCSERTLFPSNHRLNNAVTKQRVHKTYKVVTNSYMQSACKTLVADPGHSLNIQTSVMLTNYLEKLGVIKKKSAQYMKVTEE